MKSRTSLWAVCLFLATVFLLPQAAHATCTLATLNGTFNYFVGGTSQGKIVVIEGTFVADGAGHFSDTNTVFIPPSLPTPNADQGTYQINSDCTGTLVFHFSSHIVHFDFALANGATEFYLVCSDQETILSGLGII